MNLISDRKMTHLLRRSLLQLFSRRLRCNSPDTIPDRPRHTRRPRSTDTSTSAFDDRSLQLIATNFDRCAMRYGATPKSALWQSEATQKTRFRILAASIPPSERNVGGLHINDVGCAYGALFGYLSLHGYLVNGQYYGYDISQEMIDLAYSLYGRDPRAQFYVDSEPRLPADYTFASGTFGYKNDRVSADSWEQMMLGLLLRMAERSRRGIAFNLLRARPFPHRQPDGLFYRNPAKIRRLCERTLSGKVSVITGYLPNDFTVVIRF